MNPYFDGCDNSKTVAVWTVIGNNIVCVVYVVTMVLLEPRTLDCNKDDLFVCQNIPRGVTNLIMIISPCVLSFLTSCVVLLYFVRKVTEQNKVGPEPASNINVGIEMDQLDRNPAEEMNQNEQNVSNMHDESEENQISIISMPIKEEIEIRRKNWYTWDQC